MAADGFEHIVVIGASSGGLEALRAVAAELPSTFPAPICVVLHTAPESPRVLHKILGNAGALPAEIASNGIRLRPGRIYVAPPDWHLLVEPGVLSLGRGPRENLVRPAIDPLFRSAAQVYGPRVIGVVLTGNLDDGTAGLWTIKRLGGVAVVQDPEEATFPSMPESALRYVDVDHRVQLRELADVLVRLTAQSVHERIEEPPPNLEVDVDIARGQNSLEAGVERAGEPSAFACPECHGVLREWMEADRLRFRCHTGHAYSSTALLAALGEGVGEALWNSIRVTEEAGRLMRHLAERVRESDSGTARSLEVAAAKVIREATTLRSMARERGATIEEPSTTNDG